MFAGFALLLVSMIKFLPTLPASRLLHQRLVEAPARKLAAMTQRHLIYAALLLGTVFAGAELVFLLGSADMAMLLAWDVSLYVDAVITTVTLSLVARGKAGCRVGAACVVGFWRKVSRPRSPRRHRDRSRAANDADEGGEQRTYAFAA